jgi:hypothetical protein
MTREDLADRVSGLWFNQLGSRVMLNVDEDGRLSGSMHSNVGGVEGEYAVIGSFDASVDATIGVIGFVVDWYPVHSVCTWSGRYDPDADVIDVAWLLTDLVGLFAVERDSPRS